MSYPELFTPEILSDPERKRTCESCQLGADHTHATRYGLEEAIESPESNAERLTERELTDDTSGVAASALTFVRHCK